MPTTHLFILSIACALAFTACGDSGTSEGGALPTGQQSGDNNGDTSGDTSGGTTTVDQDPPGERGTIAHQFSGYTIGAGRERSPCVSWTLNNDEPLYVEKVTLSNNGAYHHSNWFVVPEDVYPGEDGFWRCSERNFDELQAALDGTVLFAQSTQSRYEEQRLGDGVVIKIPPRHKVVADVHLLNLSTRDVESELRMGLELLHPKDVKTIVTPLRLVYIDLQIPPERRSRFTATCDIASAFASQTGSSIMDMKLYWVLPHYHGLGDYFSLAVNGGAYDGQNIFELSGFNAEANGQAFNPPLDLSDAQGLSFTCGYNNPRSRSVGWGIGDQEMCVMLGFAEMPVIVDAIVITGSQPAGEEDGVSMFEGPCSTFAYGRNLGQGPPSEEELAAPLYLPESSPEDEGLDITPVCEDADPEAFPEFPTSLGNIHDTIFAPSCTFSSCHDGTVPAAGLDLTEDGLYDRLMNHQPTGDTDLALVRPGDPDRSWLYQRVAECEPKGASGATVTRMPIGSATLLDDGLVAKLRAWIEDGAPEN